VLCLLPARDVPAIGASDFTEHAAGYLVLMLWFAGLTARERWIRTGAAFFALGVALEGIQAAMGLGRVADPRDVAANTLGVALGLALAYAGLGGWMRWVEARLFAP